MKLIGSGLRLSASDVANFLACQHLTRLDLLAARGELKPPKEFDVGFLDLVARGEAHEQTVLAGFRAVGLGVAEIDAATPDAEAARATAEAIRCGADVIYQGVLLGPPGGNGAEDAALLGRPGNVEIQLDLFLDYANNVKLYPAFQEYFRKWTPPLLAIWGKNDPYFIPAGAEAFRRDMPDAVVRFFDTGHFALETHAAEIAAAIRDFLPLSK